MLGSEATEVPLRFPPSFLDEIRDRVPISEIVGTRVTYDRKKSNVSKGDHWACCPFHGEKTPSFHCEDRKGRYYCFGCGASGDHFRFLTEAGGLSFPEAVEQVAGLAGVPMPARDEEAERKEARRASLADVTEIAAKWFEAQLQEAHGAAARAYLRDRGLRPETIRRFRLGYAPGARNALKEHLAAKGIDRERMEGSGVLVHGPDIAVSYDRFRDRVIFPILDAKGRVVSFGGRAMSADVPAKYLNGPETDLFSKSYVLYNERAAREAAREAGTVVAVEGYMDVIALAQAGIGHAVAPLGTALTDGQLARLWRAAPEPVLCFDGDEAGRRAMYRAIDVALPGLRAGRTVRFASLPERRDPDDLVREGGRGAFEAVIRGARPLAETLWLRETAGRVHDTPERRAGLERTFRDTLRRIEDADVRRHYEQDMRERVLAAFGTAAGAERRDGRGRGDRGQGGRGGGGRGRDGWRDERASVRTGRVVASDSLTRSGLLGRMAGGVDALSPREAILLAIAVNHPAVMLREFDVVAEIELASSPLRRMQSALLDTYSDGEPDDAAAVRAALRTRGHGDTLERIDRTVRALRVWPAEPDAAHDDAHDCFAQAMHMHQKHSELERELRELREAAEADLAEDSYDRMADLIREIQAVSNVEAILEGFGVASGRRVATS